MCAADDGAAALNARVAGLSLIVETDTGRVRGVYDRPSEHLPMVRVFRGIPFAAPPVGDARFAPPRPAQPWPGIRAAESFGASPMQDTSGPFAALIPGSDVGAVAEDCLTLNVWTPTGLVSDLPVMMWVYGGAFLTGGTAIETYDASRLCAEQEVVVVSANYRVGAFGFLWLGDHGGEDAAAVPNAGLLDQLVAMQWVGRNVSAFGGDPTRLTVFGESAGAGSLLHLHASPLSKGMFSRFVCQSAGIDQTLDVDSAGTVTSALVEELKVGTGPRVIDRLRAIPAADLISAQRNCMPALMVSVSSMPFHPVVDGPIVPEKPSVAIAGGAGADVDLLLTWTADEMRLFPNTRADTIGRDGLIKWTARYLSSRLGEEVSRDRAADLIDFYTVSEAAQGRARGAYVWAALQTDGAMRLPARRIAESRLEQGAATYCAQFSWPARGGDWERGAFHAIDLPFVFGTLGRAGWSEFLGSDEDAERLSTEIRSSWGSFARSGVPSGPTTGPWPAYSAPDRSTTILDTPCWVAQDPLGEIDRTWQGLWSPQCRPAGFS
jgi:para-nitrobenzyl esterase